MLSFLTRGPCTDARHIPAGKRPRTLPSVAEFGWALAPCKDWPSATAYGGCGLDRGPAPNSRLPPGQRRRRPLARANPRGRFFERKWVHFRECRGRAAQDALRSTSSRARITATSFTNHYEWGDLKGDLRSTQRTIGARRRSL